VNTRVRGVKVAARFGCQLHLSVRRCALANSHSLGRKPKGQNRLPFNSHYPFPRVPQGSFDCHSCLVINYIAKAKYAHNPKVGGSNPSPATNQINKLHGFVSAPKTPITSQ
jgi:hypothetical protein